MVTKRYMDQNALNASALATAHPFQKVVVQFMLDRGFKVFCADRRGSTNPVYVTDGRNDRFLIAPNGMPTTGKKFSWSGLDALATAKTPFPHIAFDLKAA